MRRPQTPLRAISAYCLAECCLGKPNRVDACQEPECPLFAFRYGTDPYSQTVENVTPQFFEVSFFNALYLNVFLLKSSN